MNQEIKKPQSKPVVDEYKGVKRESVGVVLIDKDGKQTKIKL